MISFKENDEDIEKKPQQQSAEEIALEDRKREVEEELGEHLKERSKEHERHKIQVFTHGAANIFIYLSVFHLQEHEQLFRALLTDLVNLKC